MKSVTMIAYQAMLIADIYKRRWWSKMFSLVHDEKDHNSPRCEIYRFFAHKDLL